jgi:hypothetical protein
VIIFLIFTLIFDLAFSNSSNFVFDPDAENWRRKTVGTAMTTTKHFVNALSFGRMTVSHGDSSVS